MSGVDVCRKYESLYFGGQEHSPIRAAHVLRVRGLYLPFGPAHVPMLDLGRELSRYIAGEECSNWLEFADSFEKNLRNQKLREILIKTADAQGETITLCTGEKLLNRARASVRNNNED